MDPRSYSSKVMDPILYEAVKRGDIRIIEQYKDQLHIQLTPNKNTVLHVTAQFLLASHIINTIFDKQSFTFVKTMLTWQNSEGETALHIAAKNGRFDIVISLIHHAKDLDQDTERGAGVAMEMLRMTNKYGDTALHEAVRYNNADVVVVLVEEDPSFRHPSNAMGETPLYLGVESHYHGIVDSILMTCISPVYNGPKSRTALHAAIISQCKVCTKKLLEKIPALAKVADAFGWTPLHYAALFDFDFGASELLKPDISLAHYTADIYDKKTALHVAASYGSVKVMKEILKHRPDCWEMITSKGQNILHLVVHHERGKALDFILTNSWALNLINQKDAEGNTPLHLYATSTWLDGRGLLRQQRANLNAFNRNNCTPLDVFGNSKDLTMLESLIEYDLRERGAIPGARNVIIEENGAYRAQRNNETACKNDVPVELRKLSETHLIVAALIATVTFAAGFTIPGGYEDNNGPDRGMAVLIKRAAFKAFLITDTIAVMSSIIAVAFHLRASSCEDSRMLRQFYRLALLLIKISLIAMVITFMTGVYTVVAPSSALALTVCVIGGFALLIFSAFIGQLVLNFLVPAIACIFSNMIADQHCFIPELLPKLQRVHITKEAPWV